MAPFISLSPELEEQREVVSNLAERVDDASWFESGEAATGEAGGDADEQKVLQVLLKNIGVPGQDANRLSLFLEQARKFVNAAYKLRQLEIDHRRPLGAAERKRRRAEARQKTLRLGACESLIERADFSLWERQATTAPPRAFA